MCDAMAWTKVKGLELDICKISGMVRKQSLGRYRARATLYPRESFIGCKYVIMCPSVCQSGYSELVANWYVKAWLKCLWSSFKGCLA